MKVNLTCLCVGINPKTPGPAHSLYTLISSSDPRGKLRGGVAGELGDAVAPGFGDGTGGWAAGVEGTRAGCMFVDLPAGALGAGVEACAGEAVEAALPGETVAFAIPMNVAGDNIKRHFTRQM